MKVSEVSEVSRVKVNEFAEYRVRIRQGWEGEGRLGTQVAPSVYVRQEWAPVVWDGEEDPDFFKEAGLEIVTGWEALAEGHRFVSESRCSGLDSAVPRYALEEKRDSKRETVWITDDKIVAEAWLHG